MEDRAFEIGTGVGVVAKVRVHWTVGHGEAARPGLRRGDRATTATGIGPPMEKLVGWPEGGAGSWKGCRDHSFL